MFVHRQQDNSKLDQRVCNPGMRSAQRPTPNLDRFLDRIHRIIEAPGTQVCNRNVVQSGTNSFVSLPVPGQ
jgi:hypothetical protein